MSALLDYRILDDIKDWEYTKFNSSFQQSRNNEYLKGDEVLRYYDDKFRVLNAKYINLNGSRMFVKSNIRIACSIIQYLNPNITENELRDWLYSKMKSNVNEKACTIRISEVRNIAKDAHGCIYDLEEMITSTSTRWRSPYPTNNPFDKEKEGKKYMQFLISERQKFALKCYNQIQHKNSIERFSNAYDYVYDTYGAVTIQDIADATKMSVGSVRNLKSKIDKMSKGIDNPRVDFKNKKYVDNQRKITKGGESIHYDDRLKITKSRVSVKASVSRPTVDNHWIEVGDYFNLLNEQLTDKQ